jgi:hypothetical protein
MSGEQQPLVSFGHTRFGDVDGQFIELLMLKEVR